MGQSPDLPQNSASNHADLTVQPPDPLFGRDAELNTLRFALEDQSAVLLYGPAGIGKTALAARVAEEYGEQHELLWFTLHGDPLHALLNQIARAYDADVVSPEDDLSEQIGRIRALLQENQPLIVLDGQIDVRVARQFVRDCATNVPVIVTHPRAIEGPWTQHEIARLDGDASNAMLLHLAGPDLEADLMDLMTLGEQLGGNPLAISIAGHHLSAGIMSPSILLTQMSGIPTARLNPPAAVLAAAYRALPAPLRGMLLLAGTTFTGGVSEELLADVSGAPAAAVRAGMRQLVTRGLATERTAYNQPYFSVHDVVQAFVYALLTGKQQIDTLRQRHLNGLLSYVQRHSRDDTPEDYDRLTAEIDTIMAAGLYMARTRRDEDLQTLIELLDPDEPESFVNTCNYQSEFDWLLYMMVYPDSAEDEPVEAAPAPQAVVTAETAEPEAEPEPETEPEAEIESEMESIPAPVAEVEAAPEPIEELEPAAEEMPLDFLNMDEAPEETQTADDWFTLEASDSLVEPEVMDAAWLFADEDAEETAAGTDEASGDAELIAPPASAAEQDAPAEASEFLTELAEESEPDEAEANDAEDEDVLEPLDIMSLAEPLSDVEQVEAEADLPSEPEPQPEPEPAAAPEVVKKAPTDEPTLSAIAPAVDADRLLEQAQQAREAGQIVEATTHYEQALEAYTAAEDARGRLTTLEALAELSLKQRSYEDALSYLEQGLQLTEDINVPQVEGKLLMLLGDLEAALGKHEGAEDAYREALNLLRPFEEWPAIGRILDKLGAQYLAQQRYNDAAAVLEQAVSIFERTNEPEMLGLALDKLGEAQTALLNWNGAKGAYRRAIKLARDAGDSDWTYDLLMDLGGVTETSGDQPGALRLYQQALRAALDLGDEAEIGHVLLTLARLLVDDTMQINRAVQLLQGAVERLPDNTDARRLLSRAKARQERLTSAGVTLAAPEPSLDAFALPITDIQPQNLP
jgi:tetratricopeptide (TPR) repeat protein